MISRKILYVEDDEDIRSAVGQALSGEGFEVTAVGSAEEAIHSLEQTTFQVMLTDYRLPGENAAWLLREGSSRGYLEKTPVIVLSAERAPAGIEGHIFLRKPIDLDVLSAALSQALADQVRPSDMPGASTPAEKLVLTLYVTTSSHVSQKAIRNLHRVLKRFDEDKIHLVIIDVGHLTGQAGALQAMEDDRIVVTPTLVVRMRGPKVWIAGDLSDDDMVAGVVARGVAGHACDAA